MAQTFTGKVVKVEDTKTVGKTGSFKKRNIILTDDDPKYPNTLPFEFTGDKTALLDGIAQGEQVTVTYNPKGRVWHSPKTDEDVYFVSLSAWKVERGEANEPEPADSDIPDDAANDDVPF